MAEWTGRLALALTAVVAVTLGFLLAGLGGVAFLAATMRGGIVTTTLAIVLAAALAMGLWSLTVAAVRFVERRVRRRGQESLAVGASAGAAVGLVLGVVSRRALFAREDHGRYPLESYAVLYAVDLALALLGVWLDARFRDLPIESSPQ